MNNTQLQELIDEQTAKLKGIAVNDIDTLVEALSVVGIDNAAYRLAAIKLNIEAIIHDLRDIPNVPLEEAQKTEEPFQTTESPPKVKAEVNRLMKDARI